MPPQQKPRYKAIVVDPLRVIFNGPLEHAILFEVVCNTNAWVEWCLGVPLSANPTAVLPRSTSATPSAQSNPPATLEVYKAIAKEVGRKITADQVRECVRASVHDLEVDEEILDALKSAKFKSLAAEDGPDPIHIYLLKTLPAKYWRAITDKSELREVFTGAFKVGPDGQLADDLRDGFQTIKVNPREAVFLSSCLLKVFMAKTLGNAGIITVDNKAVVQELTNLFGESPQLRAWNFLNSHQGRLLSDIDGVDPNADDDAKIRDQFSQLLIMQALGRVWNIVSLRPEDTPTCFKFFSETHGLEAMGVDTMSDDINTTALAHLLLETPDKKKKESMELIERQLAGGKIGFLGCNGGNHIGMDIVMYANILRLAYRLGREKNIGQKMNQIMAVLEYRAYDDTYTNNQAQMFLYFLTCLVVENPSKQIILKSDLERLKAMLIEAVKEQVGQTSDPLAIAMVALARQKLGIEAKPYITRLKRLQCVDGGWGASVYAVHGLTGLRLRSRGVTTAFALKAIEEEERIARLGPETLMSKATKPVLAWLKENIPHEVKEKVLPWIQKIAGPAKEMGPSIGGTNLLGKASNLVLYSGYLTLLAVAAGISITGTYFFNILRSDGESDVAVPCFDQMAALWFTIFSGFMVYRHGNPATDWRNSAFKVNGMVENVRTAVAGKLGGSLITVGNTVKEKLTPKPKRTIVIEMQEAGDAAVTGLDD